jgi:plastocyanin
LKRILALAIGVVTVLTVPSTASAATSIGVFDDFFTPVQAPQQTVGDSTVTWNWDSGAPTLDEHDVASDNGLFDSGSPTHTGSFSVSASAGTFPYHCTVHELQGMEGTVSVAPIASNVKSKSFKVTWASNGTNTGNKFDVKYKVGSKSKTWLKETKKKSATFGKKKKPIKVKSGQHISVQVRSRKGKHKSGYSPPVAVDIP